MTIYPNMFKVCSTLLNVLRGRRILLFKASRTDLKRKETIRIARIAIILLLGISLISGLLWAYLLRPISSEIFFDDFDNVGNWTAVNGKWSIVDEQMPVYSGNQFTKVLNPVVEDKDGVYYMWNTGLSWEGEGNDWGMPFVIELATSTNLLDWLDTGISFIDDADWVMPDTGYWPEAIEKYGDLYIMSYMNWAEDDGKVGLATGYNLVDWTPLDAYNPVLQLSDLTEGGFHCILDGHIRFRDPDWCILYQAQFPGDGYCLGLATALNYWGPYTDHGKVFTPGGYVENFDVRWNPSDSKWHMLYSWNFMEQEIGHATSVDYENWTDLGLVQGVREDCFDRHAQGTPRFFYDNGSWRIFMTGTPQVLSRRGGDSYIGYYTSSDIHHWTAQNVEKVLKQSLADGTFCLATLKDLEFEDVEISVEIHIVESGPMRYGGLAFRLQDNSNFYWVGVDAAQDKVVLKKVVGGESSDLSGSPADFVIETNQRYFLRVWLVGNNIDVAVKPYGRSYTTMFSLADESLSSKGNVGLVGESSVTLWDKVRIILHK